MKENIFESENNYQTNKLYQSNDDPTRVRYDDNEQIGSRENMMIKKNSDSKNEKFENFNDNNWFKDFKNHEYSMEKKKRNR